MQLCGDVFQAARYLSGRARPVDPDELEHVGHAVLLPTE